jgi:hypothetical protein
MFERARQAYTIVSRSIERFPKEYRYTLGERWEMYALKVIEHTARCETTLPPLKDRELVEVVVCAQTSLVLARLCTDKGIITPQSFFEFTGRMQEVVKIANSWRKALIVPQKHKSQQKTAPKP